MATYTTAALVRKYAENLDASLADADINAFIEEGEQYLNVVMGESFLTTFSATSHGILRSACNAYAASLAVLNNPSGFTSLQEADVIVAHFESQFNSIVQLLSDAKYVTNLRGTSTTQSFRTTTIAANRSWAFARGGPLHRGSEAGSYRRSTR